MRIRITKGNSWYNERVGEVFKTTGRPTSGTRGYYVNPPHGFYRMYIGLPFIADGHYEVVGEVVEDTEGTVEDAGDIVGDIAAGDNVDSPHHYTAGDVEVIDIIRQAVDGATGFEAVCLANCVKYLMRYRHKNGVEDLFKAEKYLQWLIAELKNEQVAKGDE